MKAAHFHQYLSGRYQLQADLTEDDEIIEGTLTPADDRAVVPIRGGGPRFVAEEGYAGTFGLQWNAFRSTPLDSGSGLPLTFKRFWIHTRWKPRDL